MIKGTLGSCGLVSQPSKAFAQPLIRARNMSLLSEAFYNSIYEPRHEKTCLCHMLTTKAHPRSLISAFVVRCLDSIIHLVSISKISSL